MLRFIQKGKQLLPTFCQTKQPVTYPYLFGGLPLNCYPQKLPNDFELIVLMLGESVKQNFRQAYIAYLQALRNKDHQLLSSVTSKQLYESISLQNVKLVNPDSQVSMQIDKEYLIVGAGFDRSTHVEPWQMVGKQQQNKYFKIYKTNLHKLRVPLLFSVEVYFRSKMKLISSSPADATSRTSVIDQNAEQVHMVQFECERKQFLSLDVIRILVVEHWKSMFNPQRNRDIQAIKRIMDLEKGQWKIADVDRLLDGNFDKLKAKPEDE